MLIERPIAFFDLETTGINLEIDRIVEISIIRLSPDMNKSIFTSRLNPECQIPEEVSAIHGIYDADVEGAPTFNAIAPDISAFLDGCDLGGYNAIRFDLPFLEKKMFQAGFSFSLAERLTIDPFILFKLMEPTGKHTLSVACEHYLGHPLLNAHSAKADINATIEVLEAQIRKYSAFTQNDLPSCIDAWPSDMQGLHKLCTMRLPDTEKTWKAPCA